MRAPAICEQCGRQWWPFGKTGRPPGRCDQCDPENAMRRASYHMRNARGALHESVLLDVTHQAESIDPLSIDRCTLRRAIVNVAHAEGPFEMRTELLALAALAVAWAARLPTDAKDAA